MKTITRIAPSPTGKFHIGTARTALFNYLFVRQKGGKFLLRIEDTDRARSSQEHITDIKNSLEWLGLDWDNRDSEHYQSRRIDEYKKAAQELIERGCGYKKEGAIYFKTSSVQNRPHLHLPLVRGGTEGLNAIEFTDLIHGKVSTPMDSIEDFVILKSDGWPTFHMGVVVDDHDMGVTHVIRGDDHLSNTPKHILLYRALGWELPQWGHLPLILNTDRTKMSKRKDPVSVTDDFKAQGFLPEALVNYLAFLGWNPKTDEEYFSLVELVERFKIQDIQKSNAVFDIGKLRHINSYYLRKKTPEQLLEIIKPLWSKQFDPAMFDDDYLKRVIVVTLDRAEVLNDFAKDVDYFFNQPKLNRDELIFKKSSPGATLDGLTSAINLLDTLSANDWTQETLRKTLEDVVEKTSLTNGDVFWPVRYCLTGAMKSPSPQEMLEVLGREESLKRLKIAQDLLQ